MRKLLFFLALNTALPWSVAAQPDPCLGSNLWFNGDFEQSADEIASGWNTDCFPLVTPYPTITTTSPNGFYPFFDFDHTIGQGGHFIWMDFSLTPCLMEGVNSTLLRQIIPTEPGQIYQFSLWTRVHCSNIGGAFGLAVNGILLETVDLENLAQSTGCWTGWQQFSVQFTATGTQAIFSVVNVNWMDWGYDFAFDDIEVQSFYDPEDAGLPDSLAVCEGTCEVLSPLVGQSFLWSNGSADPTLTICPLVPGAFSVTVTLSNDCEITDTTFFSLLPVPAPALIDSVTVCPTGCFPLETDEWSSYLWSTGDTTASVFICLSDVLMPAVYLQVTNENGCTGRDSTIINYDGSDSLSVGLESPLEIEFGDEIILNPELSVSAFQIDSIRWEPPTGLSCDDCLNPAASPDLDATYTLWLQDVNGCTASASLQILVKTPPVYVPNVIYPESSAGNDRFTVFAKDGAVERILRLQVFDRWGELVFDGKNFPANDLSASGGWDGFFKGKKMDAQVLIWQARVLKTNGEEVFLTGEVTVLK